MTHDNVLASEYLSQRLRNQHTFGVSDDDETIANLLDAIMTVEVGAYAAKETSDRLR